MKRLHLVWMDHGPIIGLRLSRHIYLRLGWGYDDEVPVSLTPLSCFSRTPLGMSDWCGSWAGFYVGVTWG